MPLKIVFPLSVLTALVIGLAGGVLLGGGMAPGESARQTFDGEGGAGHGGSGGTAVDSSPRPWFPGAGGGGSAAREVRPIGREDLETLLGDNLHFGGLGMNTITKFSDIAGRLSVSDLPALAEEMARSGTASQNGVAWQMVLAALTDRDPDAAWQFARNLPAGSDKQSAMHAVISTLAGNNPTRALALVQSVEDQQLRRTLRPMAIMHLASRDPAHAFELVTSSGEFQDEQLLYMVFGQWTRRDPDAARSAMERLEGNRRDQASRAVLNTWATTDPEAAWEFAKSLPPGHQAHVDPRQQVISSWAQSDPKAALQAAMSLPQDAVRNASVASAVNLWAQRDLDSALDYALEISDSTVRSDVLRMMSTGRVHEPEKMFAAVLEHMPTGDNFQQAVNGIFSNWARENPGAAALATEKLPSGQVHSQAVSQVASQWAINGNSEEALRWASGLSQGQSREGAIRSIFQHWGQRDLSKAVTAFEDLPGDDRRAALQPIASAWARNDHQAALQWGNSLSDAQERRTVVREAVRNWAEFAPAAASAYAMGLPEEERSHALRMAVDRWGSKDAEAAAQWLASQPSGNWKDGAIASLSRKIASEDPETALSWASTISDQRSRNREVERMARDWMRQDSAAARNWISNSRLSEETRERLLR